MFSLSFEHENDTELMTNFADTDWAPKFYKANLPVFKDLYASVRDGTETRRSLEVSCRIEKCQFRKHADMQPF
jgi:hypothetical protein